MAIISPNALNWTVVLRGTHPGGLPIEQVRGMIAAGITMALPVAQACRTIEVDVAPLNIPQGTPS